MADLRELVQAAEDALHAVREAVEAQGDQNDTPAPDVTPVPEATVAEAVPVTPSEPTVIPVTDGSETPEETPAPEASTGPAVAPSDAPLPV